MKSKIERQKINYRPYSFRLHEKTVENMNTLRGNVSWNKFFKSFIDEKSGIKCYFCGSCQNLEIHHIIAIKDGGSDDKDNKMMLCPSCHKKTENWGNKKKKN